MPKAEWRHRLGRGAAAWLLSLILCLGSVGDLLAASAASDGPFSLAGEICHSPGTGEESGGRTEPRAAHDCCVVCHAIPDHQLAPPPAVVIGPVAPASKVVFAQSVAAPPRPRFSHHHRARAPPSV